MDAVTLSAFKYGKAGESPKVPPFVRTTVNMLAKDTGNEMLLFPVVVDEYNPHCIYFERMIKMPLNAKDARIFIKFNSDGTRDDTRIEGANLEIIPTENGEIYASAIYADGTYDELDLTNYIETSYEDYMLYCGNSPDGKEYIRNMETGEPMEKPPYVPTTEEKLASLDAEYQQKFDEINNAIIIAVTEGDTELQQELVAEKAALKEEYTTKRGEL